MVIAMGVLAGCRARRRPRLWAEAALVGVGYVLYDQVRDIQSVSRGHAIADGHALLRWEHGVGLAHEDALNSTLAHVGWLTVAANYWYAVLHLGVTATVLTWLYLRRPGGYRSTRRLLFGISLIAFVGFWLLPTAPPRLLPGSGFVDTLAQHHTIGSYETGSLATAANLYASMPSLHVAWAVWVSVAVWRHSRSRAWRAVAVAYPVVTSVDVIATANHYVVDTLAAGVLVATAVVAQHGLRALRRAWCPRVAADTGWWRPASEASGRGPSRVLAPVDADRAA